MGVTQKVKNEKVGKTDSSNIKFNSEKADR
jgi:hypothetical protein